MPEESPEPPSSYPKSVRLTPEEIAFLDKHDISLADLAHEGIAKKQKEQKKLSTAQKKQKAVIDGIYLMIGVAFIWTLNFSNNIMGIVIVGGLGAGFIIIGTLGLYKGMKTEGIFDRLKSK